MGAGGEIAVKVTTADVTTQPGRRRTAAVEASYLSLLGTTSFVGSGTVRVAVAANFSGPRLGSVLISVRVDGVIVAGEVANIRQAAYVPDPDGPCTFVINLGDLTTTTIADAHGMDVYVNTAPKCSWTASTSASFMTLIGPASFTGTNDVRFHLTANRGGTRVATAVIAGQTVTITQEGGAPSSAPDCTVDLSSSTNLFSPSGGSIVVKVLAAPDCEWTAQVYAQPVPSPEFLSLNKTTGTGTAQITVTAAPNSTGSSRGGTLSVNFRQKTLLQD